MNKAIHAFVYLFLILAGAGLWFEIQLNAKRTLLTDRNRMQEEYFIKVAKTVEKDDAPKDATVELKKDVSPVEARHVDSPEMENVLEEYKPYLETQNLDTFNWDNESAKTQLRTVYVMDAEGKPKMDGNRPLMRGPGTEHDILEKLLEAAMKQQARLNTTRAELAKLRGVLEENIDELNKLKPVAREDKVTITKKEEQIEKLEGEKSELENQIVKIKAQIDELNGEITSLRDEVQTAKDEAAAKAEDLEKSEKLVAKLTKQLEEAYQTKGGSTAGGAGAATSIPVGDKGKVVKIDNVNMFAVIELTPEAMHELKGNDTNAQMPRLEFSVKRDGEFIGRIRIRQEVAGKNFAICDVLANWCQGEINVGDVVFAD